MTSSSVPNRSTTRMASANGGSRSNPTPVLVWNGHHVAGAFALATSVLDYHRNDVNALNVFPVPDGDTGTNMALTMKSALAAIEDAPESAAEAASRLARGALMGARGNSGVILSQIFRGFAAAIQGQDEIDGRDLAMALDGARDMAYKAVMRPVEGTMLSVIRGAAEQALPTAKRTPSLVNVLSDAVAGAQTALDATPGQLDILRQAGVVDAGGQGVVYILTGLGMYANGESFDHQSVPPTGQALAGANMKFLDQVEELHGTDSFGYCTNFMVLGEGFDFERCRKEIAAMGESAVIVGDDTVLKVHIHTTEPGKVLSYALSLGELDQIKIDNMTRQADALGGQQREATGKSAIGAAAPTHAGLAVAEGRQAIIAVAPGEGVAEALQAMGATHIVRGGQTMNPSTRDLLDVIEGQAAGNVIILPNNKNIILTAGQVSGMTGRTVDVVPTTSVPQALAALASFNAERSMNENVQNMKASIDTIQTIELTRAVRDAELDGIKVVQGQVIGILNGALVSASQSLIEAARDILNRIDTDSVELVSVFTGEDTDDASTAEIVGVFEEHCPNADIEIHAGGQAHYLFIIGVE